MVEQRFTLETVRRKLPNSAFAFLGRFSRLTEIQARAIPVIHEGKDALVVAQAASGKTEAVMVPLTEKLLKEHTGDGLGLLYVVPTRALANDIERRVAGPLRYLSIKLVVRTGDKRTNVKKSGAKVVVTTPESLDSLLARQPDVFKTLKAIVIDEAHLLEDSVRGDQVSCLVRRLLKWHCENKPQLCAMSATVSKPHLLALKLFGAQAEVITVETRRPITVARADNVAQALAIVRSKGIKKTICFCNSRQACEDMSQVAIRLGFLPKERIFVHHASLSRRDREEVEEAMRVLFQAILFCTSTMEMGVDIGDVDCVILYGAPPSVSSFLQRIGRGCRRKQGLFCVLVPEYPSDEQDFEEIRKALEEGDLGEVRRSDPSCIVQQAFSLLFARPQGATREELFEVMGHLWAREVFDRVIDYLILSGYLVMGRRGLILASSKVMDMGEKGVVHSHIKDAVGTKVIDAATGRVLGEVANVCSKGELVVFSGRLWRVRKKTSNAVYIEAFHASFGEAPKFVPHLEESRFAEYLPPDLFETIS